MKSKILILILSSLTLWIGCTDKVTNYIIDFVMPVDTLRFDERLLRHADVDFPEIHMLICFKESSACMGMDIEKKRMPTLCSQDWIEILGFNLHNYSGVKQPRSRLTTSLGSIGSVYSQLLDTGFRLKQEHKWMHRHLINNEHAVYASPLQHAIDLKLRQECFYKHTSKPKSPEGYIEFLRTTGYNPYSHYYDDDRAGLHQLHKLWKRKIFHGRFGTYFRTRMGVRI